MWHALHLYVFQLKDQYVLKLDTNWDFHISMYPVQ